MRRDTESKTVGGAGTRRERHGITLEQALTLPNLSSFSLSVSFMCDVLSVQVTLRVWPGSGGGQVNIEGGSRSHPLPEMLTCVAATCNATSEANELLVENVMLAGTEKVRA